MLPLAINCQVSQQLPRTNETECWRSHGTGLYEFTSLTSHIRKQGTAKLLEDSASGDPIEKEKSTVDKNMTDCNDTAHDTLDRWKENKQHLSLQQGLLLAQRAYFGQARIMKRPYKHIAARRGDFPEPQRLSRRGDILRQASATSPRPCASACKRNQIIRAPS